MRNLKRALSLAMASVMLLGMMVVGTSAAGYSDVSAEQNQEAIEVLQAAGIMTGDQNGNFNPAANVTRNEMAVVMSNLMDYTVSTYKGTSPFTDVPDWAEPYVAACYTNGIIAGYSDTTFGGNDPVTTGQAALMLLKALGYFQEPGDFGEDWLVATTKQGALAELFDGVDTGATDPLTRNDVAQLVLNALQADCVRVGSHDLVSDGKGGFTTKAVYVSRTGTDAKYQKIEMDGIIQLGEELYNGDLERRDDIDAFGRPAAEWKYSAKKIGLYADDSNLISTYTAKAPKGELYSTIGSSVYNNLGGEYDLLVFVDGAQVTAPAIGNYFDKNSTAAAGVSGNGVLTELYVDSIKKEVRIVMVNTYLVKATADYNATKEELTIETVEVNEATDPTPALPATISNDDLNVSDFKENDYILVTVSLQGATPSIESVARAELVTGEVSEYTETDYVIMDGTKYKYNKLVGTDESKVAYTIGEDAKVVLDAYGYILYVDEAVSTSSYIYVQQTAPAVGVGSKTAANVFFADGVNDAVILKKVAGNTDTDSLLDAGGWYTFIKDSADQYSLARVIAPQSAKNGANVNNTASFSGDKMVTTTNTAVVTNSKVDFLGDGSIKANADTVFILWNAENETYVYTGVANAPTVKTGDDSTGSILVNYIQKNGYATYVFIDTSRDADAAIDDVNNVADYLFILKPTTNKTVVGENTYYQYEVLFDGEKTTKYIEQSIVGADAQGVMVYNVKANDKDYITSATTFVDKTTSGAKNIHKVTDMDIANNGKLTQSGKTISVTGDINRAYIVDNDTKIYLVYGQNCELRKDNGAKYELYSNLSASGLAGLVKGYELDGLVYAVVDDQGSDVLDYLYVYVEHAKETVAPSNDTSISGFTVKGVAATKVDATHYEVTLNSINAQASSGEQNFALVGAAAGARITAGKYDGADWNYWASDSDLTQVGGKTFEFTVTAQDNTTTKTYYVKVLAVETAYTLKVTNNNTAAARVTVGNTTVTIANGETSDVLATVSASDSVNVTIKLSGGGAVTLDACATANVWSDAAGTYEVSDFTSNTTLTIKSA